MTLSGEVAPDPAVSADVETLPPLPVEERGKSRVTLRDATVRQALALLFFGLFAVTVVLSFVKLGSASWQNTKDWLQIILPAETALLGSATGFYFGTRGTRR